MAGAMNDTPGLEERVAALEEAIRFPLQTAYFPPMSDEETARFREELEKAARQPYRILSSPPPLTPDQVRYLLRECVTVVKPGETLMIRGADWTPRPGPRDPAEPWTSCAKTAGSRSGYSSSSVTN